MLLNQSQFCALSSTHCPTRCIQRHTIAESWWPVSATQNNRQEFAKQG